MFWKVTAFYLNLVLIFVVGCAAFLPFRGSIFKGGNSGWYKRLRPHGKWFFYLSIVAVLLQVFVAICNFQYDIFEDEDNVRKETKNSSLIDSLNRRLANENLINLENNQQKLTQTFVRSLAEYKLKYDSTTNRVVKAVIDSTGKEKDPVLGFCVENCLKLDSSKNGITKFKISVCNYDAVSNDISIDVFVMAELKSGKLLTPILKPLKLIRRLTLKVPDGLTFGITHEGDDALLTNLVVLIKGHYKSKHGKIIPLREIRTLNIHTGEIGTPNGEKYEAMDDEFIRFKI